VQVGVNTSKSLSLRENAYPARQAPAAGYSHSFAYCYDALNRLTQAVATGTPSYNMTYNYDQYGNVSCGSNTGGLPCPQNQYNSGNNQLTYIGSQPVTYDAAGNQRNDQYDSYQYDAEGRVKLSSSLSNPLAVCPTTTTPGPWQCPVYNALGQRVEDYQADSQGNAMTLTYPVDITGRRTGTWDQWPAQNWTGWDVYWSRVAGQHISMGGGDSWLAHSDAIGSTTMVTDETGAWVWDQVFGPWGHVWQQTGTRPWFVFAGLHWPVNDPLKPSATREYSSNVFRWMTPDPDGGHLEDPQTLNKYAYVRDNPTSLNDPRGLDFYLTCTHTDQNAQTCQQVNNGGQKDWVQGATANGQFTATVISNGANGALVDQNGNQYAGTFNQNGVTFTLGNTTSNGVFENGSNPTTLSGSGIFQGFTGRFNDNCGGTCIASGAIFGPGSSFDTAESQMLRNPGLDFIDIFHLGATNFRYGNSFGPDPHVVDRNPRKSPLAQYNEQFHYDGSYPYATVPGFFDHFGSALGSIGHVFTGPHELPPPTTIPQ
jgi:RHS repeat-associated protein